jgi:IclR family acetate operon transcriptional repressor
VTNVASLQRGLRIVDLLIEIESDTLRRPHGLAVQQAARELGVHTSTASRLMQTLVAMGYAAPLRGSRRGFRLGPAVQLGLGLTVGQRRLSELAHPTLVRLVDQTGECAHAAVAAGPWALVIDDAETGQALRVVAGKGRRVPLHCTSAGKCLLAFGLAAIPAEMPARTTRTITNPEILRLHLAEIAERGFALDDEENYPGVRCVSAPVFNGPGGEPIGCIGIDGPSVRMVGDHLSDMTDRVIAAAAHLSSTVNEIADLRARQVAV